MARDFGHRVSGLGPKQSVDEVARAIVALHPAAASRGVSARASRAGSTVLNAAGAAASPTGSSRKYGRRRDAV